MKLTRYIVLVCLSLSFFHCNEKLTDSPVPNKQPSTFLWLYPDSSVGQGVSRQHLHWWGEDPDGVIQGYLFAFVPFRAGAWPVPDTLTYSWVTQNDTIIQFPLDTLFRDYTVFVRAVDNTFTGLTAQNSHRATVRLTPSPYVDGNRNGVFDGGDQSLVSLTGAIDPKGAMLVFPVRNSPPSIAFASNPNDPGNTLRLPDTTFTVVSIGFKGSDPDGENNLAAYRIALNDTSNPANWVDVRLRDTLVTLVVPRARSDAAPNIPGTEVPADVYSGNFQGRQLVGQVPGMKLDAQNVLFVQARDVAGEFSPAIRLPSATQSWYVKRPRAALLLVGDYTRNDGTTALSTYRTTLAAVAGGQFANADFLNISLGVTITDKTAGRVSRNIPPFIDPALVQTFLLFDYVFFYTDEAPTLSVLQSVPFFYLQNGGKLLFSTLFSQDFGLFNATAAFREFAPIDSVCGIPLGTSAPPAPPPVAGDSRIPGGYVLFADSSDPGNIYPQLAFNTSPGIHLLFMRPVYRRVDARYIYRLQRDQRTPVRYTGTRHDLLGAHMTGSSNGWLVGADGIILRTNNAGAMWADAIVAPGKNLNDVAFTDQLRGTAAGNGGVLYRTVDGGQSWTNTASGTTSALRAVTFVDASRGLAVGDIGTILRTVDGGASWSAVSGGTNANLRGVYWSGTLAIAVGTSGTIIRSVNDGATWTGVPSGITRDLNSIAVVDPTTAVAVADSGKIVRSTDGGISWQLQTSGTVQSLNGVSFGDAVTGYVVGNAGTILKSSNAGATWTSQSVGGAGLLKSVSASDASTALIGGSSGIILFTANGGATWTYQGSGTINVAVLDGLGKMAFFGLPLHLLNNSEPGTGNQGLTALFTKLFTQHFSPLQKIDRRKF